LQQATGRSQCSTQMTEMGVNTKGCKEQPWTQVQAWGDYSKHTARVWTTHSSKRLCNSLHICGTRNSIQRNSDAGQCGKPTL